MKVTNYKGVEPAMEWLLAHVDEEIPKEAPASAVGEQDSPAVTEAPSTSSNATEEGVAKSLKCDDCGKLCKDRSIRS